LGRAFTEWISGCVDMGIYACMYVCMYACMHACMYVYIMEAKGFWGEHLQNGYLDVWIWASMHVCMYACMHACMHVYIMEAKGFWGEHLQNGYLDVWMLGVNVFICMYVMSGYLCVYASIYVYTGLSSGMAHSGFEV
jgi:hypothetical protein